ncbi:MAG: Hsp20 family protein [Spirochaetes bacterium]|nr:Hsp20 family protein [Spirochaetota bacterium]
MSAIQSVCRRRIKRVFNRIDHLLGNECLFPPQTYREYSGFMNLGSKFVIRLKVPGYSKKDLDITLKPGKLVVTGYQVKEDKIKRGKKTVAQKKKTKHFTKTFGLPADINQKKKAISLQKGILTVTLYKKKGQ